LNSTTLAIVAIVAVGGLALLLRRGSGSDAAMAARPDPGAPIDRADDEDDDEQPDLEADDDREEDEERDAPAVAEHPVPVTSGGVAILPFRHGVRLVALHPPEEEAAWLDQGISNGTVSSTRVDEQLATTRRQGTGIEPLRPGDFTGARVRRDAEGAWRLETLGRDGEFGYMTFEVESAARTALEMFEHAGVVQRPVDEDGHPIPTGAEDFEEARRRFEETERELALSTDDDEPASPNDWSSRR